MTDAPASDRLPALAAQIDDACLQMQAWLQTLPRWPVPPVSGSVTGFAGPQLLSEADCALHLARHLNGSGVPWDDLHLELARSKWLFDDLHPALAATKWAADIVVCERERLLQAAFPAGAGVFEFDAMLELKRIGPGSDADRLDVEQDIEKVAKRYLSSGITPLGYVIVVDELDRGWFPPEWIESQKAAFPQVKVRILRSTPAPPSTPRSVVRLDVPQPTPDPAFNEQLADAMDVAYSTIPKLDRRVEFPWLTGCLGDPHSPVWFVAENPSTRQVEKVTSLTPESQWTVSDGDLYFREMLAKHGFKTGGATDPGGWNCYITDVVKHPDVAKAWGELSDRERWGLVETWAPVLALEMRLGKPMIIVSMGTRATNYLRELWKLELIPHVPVTQKIYHYTYLFDRPEPSGSRRPQRDSGRLEEWDSEFAAIARQTALLSAGGAG